MKKPRYLLIVLLFILSFAFIFSPVKQSVYADTDDKVTYTNYYNYELDKKLFDILLKLKNELKKDNNVLEFSTTFFTTEYATITPTTSDGTAIKNDLSAGKLNLTIGENSPYECLQSLTDEDKITDITGLNNIDMSGIQTLILDGHAITSVTNTDFANLTDIRTISMNNNNLTRFEINPSIDAEIVTLSLRDNKLKTIDLSSLAPDSNVDLAGNFIENYSDITFARPVTSLDLAFNNITTAPANTSSIGCEPIFLVQGLNKTSFSAGDKVAVVNHSSYVTGLSVKVNYFAGDGENPASSYYTAGTTIAQSASAIGFNTIFLPAGKLDISFSLGVDVNIPEADEAYLLDKYIASRIPAPNITAKSNGQTITSYSNTSPLTFSFSLNIDQNVANLNRIVQDAVIFTGTQGSETAGKNAFILDTFGSKTILSYYVFDSITGEKAVVSATYSPERNTTFSIVLIIIIAIGIGTVVYMARWIKNGAPIAPLSDRERFKELRRQRKNYEQPAYEGDDEVIGIKKKNENPVNNSGGENVKQDENDLEYRDEYSKEYGSNYGETPQEDEVITNQDIEGYETFGDEE